MYHISLENSQRRLKLCFKPHLNRSSAQEVMAFQSAKSLNFRNFKIPNLESWEKWHLDATPMANCKEYYKGEGDSFPQVQALVSLVSLCMPMVRSCTKSAPTMH